MFAPYRRLGRIIKAHGTKGEVVVALRRGLSLSDVLDGTFWLVPPTQRGPIRHRIAAARDVGRGVLMRFDGIDDAACAHELVGRWLLAEGAEEDAQQDDDELLGHRVVDVARGVLGVVADVIVTGANDVLVVEGERYGQVLIPVIPDVILGIDERARTIEVDLLDGLIDEDADR